MSAAWLGKLVEELTPTTILTQKQQGRQIAQATALIPEQAKSQKIFEQVENLESFVRAKVVMLYWSMSDEVFTHDFANKWIGEKEIILPTVVGDNLVLKKFEGAEKLIAGDFYGIGEPEGKEYNSPENIDVIFVPGVAFDKENNRLGRGKAYYDKLLKTSRAQKVGLCFDFQFFDSIPVDEHDMKMDLVIRG